MLVRMVVMSVLSAVAGAVLRRATRKEFDPTRPRHEWGTASLRIDD
jgi:hypothetical protein